MADSKKMRQTADKLQHYIRTNQLDKLSTVFADDVRYHLLNKPVIVGIEGVKHYYSRSRKIKEGKHEVLDFTAADNRYAERGIFLGVLKTGEKIEFGFCDFLVFDKGKIKESFMYTDLPSIVSITSRPDTSESLIILEIV